MPPKKKPRKPSTPKSADRDKSTLDLESNKEVSQFRAELADAFAKSDIKKLTQDERTVVSCYREGNVDTQLSEVLQLPWSPSTDGTDDYRSLELDEVGLLKLEEFIRLFRGRYLSLHGEGHHTEKKRNQHVDKFRQYCKKPEMLDTLGRYIFGAKLVARVEKAKKLIKQDSAETAKTVTKEDDSGDRVAVKKAAPPPPVAEAQADTGASKHEDSMQSEVVGSSKATLPAKLQTCSSCENLREEIESLKAALSNLEKNHTQALEDEKRRLDEEKRVFLNRFSGELARKVGENEHDLEDVTRANRPMKLSEEYQRFCTNTWLDTKMKLDEGCKASENTCDERAKQAMLTQVLLDTYNYCKEQYESYLEMAAQGILKSTGCKNPDKTNWWEFRIQHRDIGSALELFVRDHVPQPVLDDKYFKKHVWGRSLEALKKHPLHHKSKVLKEFKWEHFESYTKDSARLSWKMVTQIPPMTFRCDGVGDPYQGDAVQDVAYASEDPRKEGNVVLLYLNPIMYHGDHLMVRGKVMCGAQESTHKTKL